MTIRYSRLKAALEEGEMDPLRYVPAHEGRLHRMLAVRSVPGGVIVITALASYAALILAGLNGWPLWGQVSAALLPWIPLLTLEMTWTYKHYAWFALFYVLTIVQVGHVFEHVAQIVQIHVLHMVPKAAHGVFGALDIEVVHFVWNTFVLVSVLLLLRVYWRNPWLVATLVLAGWHEAEHIYVFTTYLATGVPGDPGLLAKGGLIFGGLPLIRPDLHMLYNLVETIPLVGAFIWQLRRVHNQWIGRALPRLPARMLLDLTNRASVVTVAPGVTLLTQDHPANRFYVVARGRLQLVCQGDDGSEEIVGEIGPGQFVGQNTVTRAPCEATVRTVTRAELLVVDPATTRRVAEHYWATNDEMAPVFQPQVA